MTNIQSEIVKLCFVDHTCEYTPYESYSEAFAVASDLNTSVTECYFVKILEGDVPRYFRLGVVGQDDWSYHPC